MYSQNEKVAIRLEAFDALLKIYETEDTCFNKADAMFNILRDVEAMIHNG